MDDRQDRDTVMTVNDLGKENRNIYVSPDTSVFMKFKIYPRVIVDTPDEVANVPWRSNRVCGSWRGVIICISWRSLPLQSTTPVSSAYTTLASVFLE